jgi:FXSXX-COOH protein
VNDEASEPRDPPVQESILADVSMTSLADLFASEDTTLAVALRRVVGDVDRSAETISGWSSYIDGSSSVVADQPNAPPDTWSTNDDIES